MQVNFPDDKELYFVCIGTDRSTGDALGPLVGMFLQQAGVPNVIGTIDEPCHAVNLHERLATIPSTACIIAIDACLGASANIGKITYRHGGLHPGAGVNKDLGTVGDISISGNVNVSGFMEYFVLQNTRLSLVMRMARQIADDVIQKLKEREGNVSRQEVATA